MERSLSTMHTIHYYLPLALSIVILAITLCLMKSDPLSEGDYVIYDDPDGDGSYRNMLTKILEVFPSHGTAIIRYRSTTAVVSMRKLQKIRLHEHSPLLIPEEPWVDSYIESGEVKATKISEVSFPDGKMGNRAGFKQIPLRYFEYDVRKSLAA